MKILMVGDIVGAPGRRAFAKVAARLRGAGQAHFVVANAENAASGNGVTLAIARELLDAGADLLTLGDHTWGQKGFDADIAAEKRVLRPGNFAPDLPGSGMATAQGSIGSVTVVNLQGRVFMQPADCPFRCADALLKKAPGGVPIVVDFHAEATSEKIAMARYLDGRVAAVAGTHTHVQTSDARVLPRGTGCVTDLGMTGASDGIIGRCTADVLKKFTLGLPLRLEVAMEKPLLEGAVFDIDPQTFKCRSVTLVREAGE
ncbi:MAG: YmdB family metallophosphoesterase [Kiritimatiellaeota bacterium]|nr:YmdB family metallophosphoesterase [Kiritimatiellota bacterium]